MYDRRKGRPRQILVSLFCLLALGYFAYPAIVGKRGLEARERLIERSRQLEPQIKRLEVDRTRFRVKRDREGRRRLLASWRPSSYDALRARVPEADPDSADIAPCSSAFPHRGQKRASLPASNPHRSQKRSSDSISRQLVDHSPC